MEATMKPTQTMSTAPRARNPVRGPLLTLAASTATATSTAMTAASEAVSEAGVARVMNHPSSGRTTR
jgi:hypothetical protein